MRFTAIRLIKDEHRSMAAVLRAAESVVGKAVSTGNPPDFKLLRAMLYYLREFPERRWRLVPQQRRRFELDPCGHGRQAKEHHVRDRL